MAGSSENESGVPAWFVDMFATAQHWWRQDDSRLLPGEEGSATVFVIAFADGCRYCGYTSEGVFTRLRELFGGPFDSGTNDFVMEHGRQIVYVVRCVASGMDEGQARALRNLLVSQAPDEWTGTNSTTLEHAGCWLSGKVIGEEKYSVQSK